MSTARSEFDQHIEKRTIKCAVVEYSPYYEDESGCFTVALPIGFSKEQYEEFLSKLEFSYDSGYGSQELFGTIWYTDGTWSSRSEYDGSEWWSYHSCPDIPKHLQPSL